ncbi:MAG TPA: hypothetical protein VE170_15290 [Candidatus Limnocylindria bacterium]|nr:hypothetical protein [Candidatus Limnocylindria bacterium]
MIAALVPTFPAHIAGQSRIDQRRDRGDDDIELAGEHCLQRHRTGIDRNEFGVDSLSFHQTLIVDDPNHGVGRATGPGQAQAFLRLRRTSPQRCGQYQTASQCHSSLLVYHRGFLQVPNQLRIALYRPDINLPRRQIQERFPTVRNAGRQPVCEESPSTTHPIALTLYAPAR